ncbi:hypothetical protein [Poriferisphaera corsica]|uniref:hypothetical protein n=1 Tax=Poriferisphaera corsica TaxID=2528020 RepID=UPI00190DBDA4|nr:hypothetical protein [Poriferisphaera corsica]
MVQTEENVRTAVVMFAILNPAMLFTCQCETIKSLFKFAFICVSLGVACLFPNIHV